MAVSMMAWIFMLTLPHLILRANPSGNAAVISGRLPKGSRQKRKNGFGFVLRHIVDNDSRKQCELTDKNIWDVKSLVLFDVLLDSTRRRGGVQIGQRDVWRIGPHF